jgi:peptide/nickel transport system ATP-binding protein
VEISDRLAVMYGGRIVETGTLHEVVREPAHPYTRGLLASTVIGAPRGQRLEAISGTPPRLDARPQGCSFAPRCKLADADCRECDIVSVVLSPSRSVRCRKVN